MTTRTGGKRFLSGLFQFVGLELKTISSKKIKSLYNMTVGYVMMKLKRKKQQQNRIDNQMTDQLSS